MKFLPFIVVFITGALLIYSTFDMPAVGDPNAPAHQHVVPRYIEKTIEETRTPNIVTSVLADYRAFDTLGEVIVIFTAGIAVALLLLAKREDEEKNNA